MSSIAEQPPGSYSETARGDRWSLDRLLAWRPTLTAELVGYGALLVIAFGLRFWDLGNRAIHHDESLHAYYSWFLATGRGYEHHPLMHGPLLFHLMAIVYLLFGVGDATARFVPAIFGVAMVLTPLLLRPWLGRVGALAAAAIMAVSPTLVYFSRFAGAGAQDIVMLVGLLLIFGGMWHYLRDAEALPKWLYLAAAGLAVAFTTKEVAYMYAAILVLYLNGATAADLAGQAAARHGWPTAKQLVAAVALMPVAWFFALFWHWEGARGLLTRLLGGDAPAPTAAAADETDAATPARALRLPRAADLLIVLGTLAAPMFAAAVEVVLPKIGIQMAALAPAPLDRWTNEQVWGALSIGALLALSVQFGTAWRARVWLVAAAIYWISSVTLFTTFFSNPPGVATGIWGSLDYWLEQQHVLRGNQPVFYYLMLAPVYEYLALALAVVGVVAATVRLGLDRNIALAGGLVALVVGAAVGDGAHLMLPFALIGLAAGTYALRGQPFRQFLVFWTGTMLLGLSAAGEKMPWLVTHLAVPLALLAALTVQDAVDAARRQRTRRDRDTSLLPADEGPDAEAPAAAPTRSVVAGWAVPTALFGLLGLAGALFALLSDDAAWANPALLAVIVGGGLAVAALALRRQAVAGLAGVALIGGLALPLTVRATGVAAYEHGDVPREMIVYTQTTPELRQILAEINRYAAQSGLGPDTPITIDATEAFTWPWAWYLRDYKKVSHVDLAPYASNPQLLNALPQDGILLAHLSNAAVGTAAPDKYGPGQRYKHRWWFPEDYRGTTFPSFLDRLTDRDALARWGQYFLHRIAIAPLGSTDAVAYFPPSWSWEDSAPVANRAAPAPRLEADGRLVAGGSGVARGELRRPAGLALDGDGNVYVADSLNNRIQKYDAQGNFVAAVGGAGRFAEPWGIAVDKAGNVYVADTWAHRIQKLDRNLNVVKVWGGPPAQPGSGSPAPLELYGPRAIALDQQGNVWVTDTGHNRVVKYSPEGEPLGAFGGEGAGPGQFLEPVAVAVAANGDLLVGDTWNNRVQRFDASFGFKGEYAVEGWASRNVENKPYMVAAADGSIYLTLPDFGRVARYGPDGRLAATLDLPAPDGQLARPLGVALDASGRVWVSDGAGGRLVRLAAK